MHKIGKHDNLILTPGEQRALEEAQQKGYLVYNDTHDRKYPPVAQAYFHLCRREGRPCVRVGMQGRHATIEVFHLKYGIGFPPDVRAEIRELGQRVTGRTWGWGDVCTQGCQIYNVPRKDAEAVAATLYELACTRSRG